MSEDYSKAWANYVADAESNLAGNCPLQEDEVVLWANNRIEELEGFERIVKMSGQNIGLRLMDAEEENKKLQQRIEELQSERQTIEASVAEIGGERDRLLLVLEAREQRIEELDAELSKYQESSFHPGWLKLKTIRDDLLREHKEHNKRLDAALGKIADPETDWQDYTIKRSEGWGYDGDHEAHIIEQIQKFAAKARAGE